MPDKIANQQPKKLDPNEPIQAQFEIQRIYTKDFSFEAPNTPHTFVDNSTLRQKAIVFKKICTKSYSQSLQQSPLAKNLLSWWKCIKLAFS